MSTTPRPTRRFHRLPVALLVIALAAPAATPRPVAAAAPASETGLDGRIGRCLELRRSRPREALELADAVLATQGLDVSRRIKALSCQGIAAGLVGDQARAVTVADHIALELERHPELPDDYRLRALSNLGAILHGAGEVYRAEQVYARTLEIGARVGGADAVRIQASTLNNIGMVHADYLDSPRAADGYFKQALALSRSVGDSDPQLLYNYAVNRVRLGEREPAVAALDQAAAAANRAGNTLVGLRVRSAQRVLDPGTPAAAALAELQTVRALQSQLPDPGGEAATLARISNLQRQTGQRAAALASARQALALAGQGHNPLETYQALDALIEAHAELGDTRAALEFAERRHAMKLDALRRQRLDLLADLQARNQDAVSQRELQRMRYEDRIRSLNAEKSRMLRMLWLVSSLVLVSAALAFGLLQRRRHRQMRTISERDTLTGLRNRRAATAALNTLMGQRCQDDARHALFLIDIDHFKRINDTHGHHTGDAVLVEVSQRLKAACRPGDLVARWGGEEFLVACADLDQAQAQAVAARLCAAMDYTLHAAEGDHPVTASLGFAPIPFFDAAPEGHPAPRWDYALRMADRALYAAKRHRDGWVGYWGAQLPDDAAAEAVLEQPEAAEGIVTVFSSHPREPSQLRELSLREASAQL